MGGRLLNLTCLVADAHGDVGMIAEHAIDADLYGKELQELFERAGIRRQVVTSDCVCVHMKTGIVREARQRRGRWTPRPVLLDELRVARPQAVRVGREAAQTGG